MLFGKEDCMGRSELCVRELLYMGVGVARQGGGCKCNSLWAPETGPAEGLVAQWGSTKWYVRLDKL